VVVQSFNSRRRVRKFFGSIQDVIDVPNLIEVQKASYDQFLYAKDSPSGTPEGGLQAVFRSVFPIVDFQERALLEFVKYEFEAPKYQVDTCLRRGMTYSSPLRVTLRLVVFDIDPDTGTKSVKDIKEQDVYMGDMPLMTEGGTFIINGIERVIVSQMHRSPGVFFDHDKGRVHSSGKLLFAARIIPYRGSWLDIEFDAKDLIYARIDRRRKLPVTSLLFALGMDGEEILNVFYDRASITRDGDIWRAPYNEECMLGYKSFKDLVDADTGEVVLEAGKKLGARQAQQLTQKGVQAVRMEDDELIGRYLAEDIVDMDTGCVIAEAGEIITDKLLALFLDKGFNAIEVLEVNRAEAGAYIRNTLVADKSQSREDVLFDIYRLKRPGELPTLEAAEDLFHSLFFDPGHYDLSAVGRVKMNMRLGQNVCDTVRVLRKDDIIEVIKTLVDLRNGKGVVDDIDNLGNRRVRSVGELMENQYRVGLLRMERSVKERMSAVDLDTVLPQDLVNAKPAVAAVREFFGSSQLSQFMDQTNPLAEVTHKRRLSALGPGGLTRERAGFEVRDVHPTHYGRVCPIETPEGPNIGLINSLATYARINRYGFIEAPYRRVGDGVVTNEIVYLSAPEEDKHYIAQADVPIDADNKITEEMVLCRHAGDVAAVPVNKVDYMDVSPKQLVSVAASLIPFLENDDANRALMGSNMQRQAVPLMCAEAPLVGTGMEAAVARDSGSAICAIRSGVVNQVDATRIVVRATDDIGSSMDEVDIYRLMKFQRSNQSTCINQRPIVKVGDVVEAGEILADSSSTALGDLALGRNLCVAFMPWNGYNFEDSVLLSESLVKEDVFASIHIEEFEVMARDTKLGPEEITRDIPNVSEEMLGGLDEAGIVHIGAVVQPGDVLVGKITPKGESPVTPEEKLLRAIFGEKASDVRDTSLRVPPGVSGTVVEVRVFNRYGVEKDERAKAIEQEEIACLTKDRDDEQAILDDSVYRRLSEIMLGNVVNAGLKGCKAGTVLTQDLLDACPRFKRWTLVFEDPSLNDMLKELRTRYDEKCKKIKQDFETRLERLQHGGELPPGVMKMLKVFVAVKRQIQPGDKVSGRHGNKGVVSRVVPVEDMPYMEDGTPVQIVLNPLGVPSRMNVGQILETHLGLACVGLGEKIDALIEEYKTNADISRLRGAVADIFGENCKGDRVISYDDESLLRLGEQLKKGIHIATPVFDGAKEADIEAMLDLAELPRSGQMTLYDGRTGEAFDREITVGYIYMLKLHHLVDDKIHARSIGPYSLVTQQPLGGKAQFGGQRFGEMEVWALEAYGAAYTLQEMLTVKSDDVAGRTKAYESVVSGDEAFEAGVPESFNVLVKEMRSLGLSVELVRSDEAI